MPYVLRQSLSHHVADVRALHVVNEHKFISGSRDKTAVVWETVDEAHFFPMKELKGAENFINCVCVMPPDETYPEGIIVTGSQDNRIFIYIPASLIPFNICRGHQNAVSALCALTKTTFASGSWDGTIKIWHVDRPLCIATHTHHNGAVFALLKLTDKTLLSASGDKLINVYKLPEIDIQRGISGHDDCVRGLAALEDDHFLSCSNDGTIRRWQADTGLLVDILHTNDSFMYSITALPDASLIVCGCEDNKIVIINGGEVQDLMVPAISVWSVDMFPSKDIIAASSDGVIRIFTNDPDRQAEKADLEEYETLLLVALGKRNPQSSSIDDLKSLPGTDALTRPGNKDGQILLVSEEGKAICYQWNISSSTWLLVGDVTGVNPVGKEPKSGKTVFEGAEYDFVFDVDVQEGRPTLKLPYSYGDNPYVVAESFVFRYGLPAGYKMEIVNFILSNVPEVPGTSSGNSPQHLRLVQPAGKQESFIYALDAFVISKNIDLDKAKAKLIEFHTANKNKHLPHNDKWVEELVEMARTDVTPSNETLQKINESLRWPPDQIYPILDLLRVAVTNSQSNKILCSEDGCVNVLSLFRVHSKVNACLINNMLIIRMIGNMVVHDAGKALLQKYANLFIQHCKEICSKRNKMPALEIALANVIINSVVINIKNNNLVNLEDLVNAGLFILERVISKEAMCRILAGLGTAIDKMSKVKILKTSNDYLINLSKQGGDDLSIKLSRIAKELLKVIQSKV